MKPEVTHQHNHPFTSWTHVQWYSPVQVVGERLPGGPSEHVEMAVVRHHRVAVALFGRRRRAAQDVLRRDATPAATHTAPCSSADDAGGLGN